MGFRVYEHGDFKPDWGELQRCYPIGQTPEIKDILYDKEVQSVS